MYKFCIMFIVDELYILKNVKKICFLFNCKNKHLHKDKIKFHLNLIDIFKIFLTLGEKQKTFMRSQYCLFG